MRTAFWVWLMDTTKEKKEEARSLLYQKRGAQKMIPLRETYLNCGVGVLFFNLGG